MASRRLRTIVSRGTGDKFRPHRARCIPVEQPTKFKLVLNLKTAKALGMTVPNSLIVSADKVIE